MNQSAFSIGAGDVGKGLSDFEILASVRAVLRQEKDHLQKFYENVPIEMGKAIRMISQCQGNLIITGIGKAGWIGQKLSASFASTGTKSYFLHAAEAFHGDFGRVGCDDLVLVLSNSGETSEIIQMMSTLKNIGTELIAITSKLTSTLAQKADCTIAYGNVKEACPHNLAPTVSTTLMLAIGDAMAMAISKIKEFTATDFARFHPGGSLGRKLQTVDEVMRPLRDCRMTIPESTIRKSISEQARKGRRSGALLVVSPDNKLLGIFTDSDLVRILEKKNDHQLDQSIETLMTVDPICIRSGQLVSEAIELLSSQCISELPVIGETGRVVGLIDITDMIAE